MHLSKYIISVKSEIPELPDLLQTNDALIQKTDVTTWPVQFSCYTQKFQCWQFYMAKLGNLIYLSFASNLIQSFLTSVAAKNFIQLLIIFKLCPLEFVQ